MSIGASSWYGGAQADHSMVANRTLVAGHKRLQVLNPGAGLRVTLPDARTLRRGRHLFCILNVHATNSLDIYHGGGALLEALSGNNGAILSLIANDTAAGRWLVNGRAIA